MKMSIRFHNFWGDFDANDNVFLEMLNARGFEVIVEPDLNKIVDLQIVSVFRPPKSYLKRFLLKIVNKLARYKSTYRTTSNYEPLLPKKNTAARNVFYTGENIRPPFRENFDGFMSFDLDNFGGKNEYLPLWMLDLAINKSRYSKRIGIEFNGQDLLKPRELVIAEKNKFMCAFISNPEPIRMLAVQDFSNFGVVDVFGGVTGNRVNSKIEVASKYKFMLCFENDLYPGYVTEKLLEAYLSNTVPVYWGDLGSSYYMNEKAFINLKDFQNMQEFTKYVANLTDAEYQEIYEQPLLNNYPDLMRISRILVP